MRRARFEGNREFYIAVGRRIADERSGKMTQEALGNRTSLTRTSIINIEKGRQQVLLHTLIDIANALGVAPAELIPETNLETWLRDKPTKGVEWIRSSANSAKR